ncbi:MAG: class I SAM-dependent methyltransferase [Elusimicrobiota bacterium]|nr:class I SAM-dependent methyltransferase [Elusimicrobiota bacterium]
MSTRPPLAAFFPLRYERPVWATGAALTAGFLALEAALHSRHSGVSAAPFWDGVYALGCVVYFVPLGLSATRLEAGALRRLLMAFAALLLAGLVLLLPPWELLGLDAAPCLQVAGMTLIVIFCARRGQKAAVAAGLALLAATIVAMAATERHSFADFLAGGALGWAAAAFADWRDLAFLHRDDPWSALRHELGQLRNLVADNRRSSWDDSYACGHWDFLDSTDQRPRHYAIAGLLADRLPREGGRVLDAGCGLATLYPLLRGHASEYVGLDLSEEALKKAAAAYGAEPGVGFAHEPFEKFEGGGFDALVLNEVLYYYPLSEIEKVFAHALARLAPGGTLIVSMNRNLKAKLIWRRLEGLAPAEQGIRVHNLRTGSYWTVKAYRKAADRRGVVLREAAP